MPLDLRILRFGFDETIVALRSFGPGFGLKVPNGKIISANIISAKVNEDVSFGFAGSQVVLELTNTALAACLISHCLARKIPLPRKGKKVISISTDFIELKITLKDTL